MNVTDVYIKKQYTCKKCNGQVYYGKVTDDQGKIVTEDGAVPNGKFGKESNVLSGAVDANDKTKFHECYLSNLQQKFRDATKLARELELGVNAGHDLDLNNLSKFLGIDGILEVSIGHALTVESIERGMDAVIGKYLDICDQARN